MHRTIPSVAGTDVASAVQGLSAYLADGVTAVDGTIAGLEALAPSPVAAGDEIVTRMTTEYTGYRTAMQDARTQIDAVDVADAATLATALPAALEGLPETVDPTAALRTDPVLSQAVDEAATCKSLPGAGG